MKKEVVLSKFEADIISHTDDIERLKRDVFRPDIEKLKLFTKMLRTNATLKRAKIFHK